MGCGLWVFGQNLTRVSPSDVLGFELGPGVTLPLCYAQGDDGEVEPAGIAQRERGVNSGNGFGSPSSWDRPASSKTSPVKILVELRHAGHREQGLGGARHKTGRRGH